MACHYPGANDLKAFWENILAQRCQFRDIPSVRLSSDYINQDPNAPDQTYCHKGAFIDGFHFDLVKHRVPKSTFESTDFVHWLALKVALDALNDADLSNIPKETTGVIVGNTLTGEQTRSESMRLRWPYVKKVLLASIAEKPLPGLDIDNFLAATESIYKSVFAPITEDTLAGALSNTIAGRICNYMDFNGGGYTVDGACSSSMLAIANAANALRSGQMDLAIAGGVDISLDTLELIGFAKTGAITKTDMHVYDERAAGFMPGEGCGFVVFKRLEDALADGNQIYAVLNGWGISSDGKGGLTAPKSSGQSKAIQRAYQYAPYQVHELDFIEGHGTGTPVGDKAELKSITEAMLASAPQQHRRQCGMTSLKSLIGHTKAASGIGAFIKAAIAVNQRILPPTFNCERPSLVFKEDAHTLYPLQNGVIRHPESTLRAGVSGMGFGGINCHVTLESGPIKLAKVTSPLAENALLASHQKSELLLFSGQDHQDLQNTMMQIKEDIQGISMGELPDLCEYYLRKLVDAPLRAGVVTTDPWDAIKKLDKLFAFMNSSPIKEGEFVLNKHEGFFWGNKVTSKKIAFIFPGQGSQKLNMASKLVQRHSWAKQYVEQADDVFCQREQTPLSHFIYQNIDHIFEKHELTQLGEALKNTEHAQPAICLSSALWLKKLTRLGIQADGVAGHSLGELSALYAAQQIDFQQLIELASLRGNAMRRRECRPGAMASLACTQHDALNIIEKVNGYVTVANINAPNQTVISGEVGAVDEACRVAGDKGVAATLLPVSNAFHSELMSEAVSEFSQNISLSQVFQNKGIEFISGIDAQPLQNNQSIEAYLSRQILAPVNFAPLMRAVGEQYDLILEVGSGRVLSNLASLTLGDQVPLFHLESKPNDFTGLHQFLAAFYVMGGSFNRHLLNEDRLIREFIPARERHFFVNPCEKPLSFTSAIIQKTVGGSANIDEVLAELSGLSHQEAHAYVQKRAQFLGDIIKADFNSISALLEIAKESNVPKTISPPSSSHADEGEAKVENAEGVIFQIIEKKTGFPASSLKPEFKLLDDLNLDSIKASELIVELSHHFEAELQDNPSELTNISLAELSALFKRNDVQQTSATGVKDQLYALLEEKYGYPAESLQPGLKLLDDLNLDSIKASEVLVELASRLQISIDKNLPEFANGSLGAIVAYFESKLSHSVEPSSKATSSQTYDGWVRDFYADWVETASPSSPITLDYHDQRYLIINDESIAELASLLREQLASLGVRVDVDTMGSDKVHSTHYDQVIVLTNPVYGDEPSLTLLKKSIATLSGIFTQRLLKKQQGSLFAVAVNSAPASASLNHQPLSALMASFYLEQPHYKVKDICIESGDHELILSSIMGELSDASTYQSIKYDGNGRRYIKNIKPMPVEAYQSRELHWSQEDLILVTGGAKGITVQCLIALAEKHPASFALVGRSPAPDENNLNHEISATLKALRKYAPCVSYHACDVADATQVKRLFQEIAHHHQKAISGFIHGSATNIPRELHHVSAEEALSEVAPKVLGALNILKHMEDNPPKLMIGFSSIIGVTGMVKNGWYGYSNELLCGILQNFHARHPQTQVVSLAYSVWDEVGMGVRMGSTHFLSTLGIDAIPVNEGIRYFLRSFEQSTMKDELIISARAKGLHTFIPHQPSFQAQGPFTETILFSQPGVELVTRSQLSKERDPYVVDHNWRGSLLFPTVLGLEAMAENVAYLLGVSSPCSHIKHIQLQRPIIVDEDKGTTIEIRALMLARDDAHAPPQIKVSIRTENTGFKVDHFSAIFEKSEMSDEIVTIPQFECPLSIEPNIDLYYSKFLFQGPMYQRIQHIYDLRDDYCLMQTQVKYDNIYQLGDPFTRDTYLQAGQIPIPKDICLPKYIDAIKRYPVPVKAGENLWCEVQKYEHTDKEVKANIRVFNQAGQLVESLSGCVNQIIEHKENRPSASELKEPSLRDETLLHQSFSEIEQHLKVKMPIAWLTHTPELPNLTRAARHQLVNRIFLPHIQAQQPDTKQIFWESNGKPVIKIESDQCLPLSISHSYHTCIVTTGPKAQGCDVEYMAPKSKERWLAMLGAQYSPLFSELERLGEEEHLSGSRIWSALEAYYKHSQVKRPQLKVKDSYDQYVMLCDSEEQIYIVTFPLQLTLGRPYMFAFIVEMEEKQYDEIPPTEHAAFRLNGNKFTHTFDTTFLDARGVGGKVYFTNIPIWMGKLRELSLKPIAAQIVTDMTSGKWAMVTNDSSLEIYNYATSFDPIVGEIYLDESLTSFDESYFYITFKWFKLDPQNQRHLIARSHISITWVKVEGHGIVKKAPLPPYLLKYISNLPKTKSESTQCLSFKLKELATLDISQRRESLLDCLEFQTSMEDSNLVGNIYYSHYYSWQARVRDKFLYQLAPELFEIAKRSGEFVCINADVNHLQEAMPFDKVEVSMYLNQLFEEGVGLYFEYHSINSHGQKKKLAYGYQKIVWCLIDNENAPISPTIMPESILRYLTAKTANFN